MRLTGFSAVALCTLLVFSTAAALISQPEEDYLHVEFDDFRHEPSAPNAHPMKDDDASVKNKRRLSTPSTCQSRTVGLGQEFNVGGYDSPYANTQSCTFTVQPSSPAQVLAVSFSFFHTEYNEDFVKVTDQDGNAVGLATGYSGDLLTPFVVAKQGATSLTVTFTSDEDFHSSSSTMQLGFNATAFDAGTECMPGSTSCSGHGTCAAASSSSLQRTCQCSATDVTQTMWVGEDCGTQVLSGATNQPQTVSGLGRGEWFYMSFRVDGRNYGVVDFRDQGASSSDPFLMLGRGFQAGNFNPKTHLPRLMPGTKLGTDYFNWYYDRSDVHYIDFHNRGSSAAYVVAAIYNHPTRSSNVAQVTGDLTFRERADFYPCVLDCSGHGTCLRRGGSTMGQCHCDTDWYGNGWNLPDTCLFQATDVPFDTRVTTVGTDPNRQAPIRVGEWRYFKFNIQASHAYQRTVGVDFTSRSPHSQPIVLLRHGQVPRLSAGYLPTYNAFRADFGDKRGFELLQGQRQSIVVPKSRAAAGDWYVGIYDIWGHTALEQAESHDFVNFDLYVNKYIAGLPCPTDENQNFCTGYSCNFNSGECTCPDQALGLDCSLNATELAPGAAPTVHGAPGLGVQDTAYFYVKITQANIDAKHNLLVELNKLNENENSFPVLLARKNQPPYGVRDELFDEHDYVARYHNSASHRILLDAEELSVGVWYFAVFNSEDPDVNEVPLTYRIRAQLMDQVDCLVGSNQQTCSGRGTCDRSIGRCICNAGYTGDDCGDDGVFHLTLAATPASSPQTYTLSVPAAQRPSIEPDDWAYYSVAVGCNMTLEVDLSTNSAQARPLLVLRHGGLPLMVASTYDFDDFYDGVKVFGRRQRIIVEPCGVRYDGRLRCYIHPAYPGTKYSTGAAKPGIWYIGVYNDFEAGGATMTDYTLTVTTKGGCSSCADGFRDTSNACQTLCPGMIPEGNRAYSNAPTNAGLPCVGHGFCAGGDSNPHCHCQPGYFGRSCSATCSEGGSLCSGHGSCRLSPGASAPACVCEAAFAGGDCSLQCPRSCQSASGYGSCQGTSADDIRCVCANGYVGDNCQLQCPSGSAGFTCSGHGECIVEQGSSGTEGLEAKCSCSDESYVGRACQSSCPRDDGGQVCSALGVCIFDDESGGATCACYDGYGGRTCNETVISSDEAGKKSKASSGSGGATGIIIAVVVCVVSVMAIGAGAFLYRRQRRTLRQYEILFGREALLQASNAQPMAGGLSGRDAENYRNHEQFEMQGVSPSSESRANPMSSVLASQIELDVVDDRDK